MSDTLVARRPILTLSGLRPRTLPLAEVPPAAVPSDPAQQRRAEARALLTELTARWPALFASPDARPLAIGTHRAIRAAMPEVDPELLGMALRLHTRRATYVAAVLTAGHPRFGLQGDPDGVVTAEQVKSLMAERARLAAKITRRAEATRRERSKRQPE